MADVSINNDVGNDPQRSDGMPDERQTIAIAAMAIANSISVCCRLQGRNMDRLRLHHAITKYQGLLGETDVNNWRDHLKYICLEAGADAVEWFDKPDPARLPVVAWLLDEGWVVVRALAPTGGWLIDRQGKISEKSEHEFEQVGRLVMPAVSEGIDRFPVRTLIKRTFFAHKKIFLEGIVAGSMINLVALSTSMYSMQVYDRVIPTQGYSTLAVLTFGVGIAVLFELLFKIIRSYLLDHATYDIDTHLSREIFSRLMKVRLDQLPSSVGSLSSQLRGYETIRSFLSSTTFYLLIDVPFGLVFVIFIAIIGGPVVGLVPLFCLLLSIAMGVTMRKQVDFHAKQATAATNLKTGLLVEAIEGAETIKAGGGGWGALSRWLDVAGESIKHEMINRSISEKSSYVAAVLQQMSYVGLVGVGAYFASEGGLTQGSLIACSILSGRALAPIAQIPGLMTQRAHAKAALDGLEKVFELEVDNNDVDHPLRPHVIHGAYDFERVRFAYPGAACSLHIINFKIQAGDKIGVVGHIGSGKSTLLRLLTGMYQTAEGRILLDGLDIDQISRAVLSERIGYLQQDHRLFQGTLRQNLLIGIPDPGDEIILRACSKTGLVSTISNHPKGLDLMISEGGKGLSGGQRQLVALTRLLLSQPCVWLLDEPTASMDEQTEQRCIEILREEIDTGHTLVLVTHKPSLLALVNRLVVVAGNQIVMDGPRDQVVSKLNELARRSRENDQSNSGKVVPSTNSDAVVDAF